MTPDPQAALREAADRVRALPFYYNGDYNGVRGPLLMEDVVLAILDPEAS